MAQKKVKTRIQQKHDIEVNWNTASNAGFVPLKGEIIIYDSEYDADLCQYKTKPTYRNYYICYERFKIGDGVSNVGALPFQPHPFVTPIKSYDNDLAVGVGDAEGAYTTIPDGVFSCEQSGSSRQLEYYNFDEAPVGYTRTDYFIIDRSFAGSVSYFYCWFYHTTRSDGFNVYIKPSACLVSNWTMANTVSDSAASSLLSAVSADGTGSGYTVFQLQVSLPADKEEAAGDGAYMYNEGIASIKITKISEDHILVEPELFIGGLA